MTSVCFSRNTSWCLLSKQFFLCDEIINSFELIIAGIILRNLKYIRTKTSCCTLYCSFRALSLNSSPYSDQQNTQYSSKIFYITIRIWTFKVILYYKVSGKGTVHFVGLAVVNCPRLRQFVPLNWPRSKNLSIEVGPNLPNMH